MLLRAAPHRGNPGRVDEHRQWAELLLHRGDSLPAGVGVGHIGRNRERTWPDLVRHSLALNGSTGRDGDRGPFSREGDCDRTTDPTSTSCDEASAAREPARSVQAEGFRERGPGIGVSLKRDSLRGSTSGRRSPRRPPGPRGRDRSASSERPLLRAARLRPRDRWAATRHRANVRLPAPPSGPTREASRSAPT